MYTVTSYHTVKTQTSQRQKSSATIYGCNKSAVGLEVNDFHHTQWVHTYLRSNYNIPYSRCPLFFISSCQGSGYLAVL